MSQLERRGSKGRKRVSGLYYNRDKEGKVNKGDRLCVPPDPWDALLADEEAVEHEEHCTLGRGVEERQVTQQRDTCCEPERHLTLPAYRIRLRSNVHGEDRSVDGRKKGWEKRERKGREQVN